MASTSSLIREKSSTIGSRRGGFHPPPNNDGGSDGREGAGAPDYRQRLRRARLGLLCATASILILFLAFTVVFVVRHGSATFDERSNSFITNWIKVPLPTSLLLINTGILLASSLSMEFARRRIARDVALSAVRLIPGVAVGREQGLPWLALTAALGIAFLCGQGMAWRKLIARGFYLASGASSSFVYLLTAAHAAHLTVGILILLHCLVTCFLHRSVESRQIAVDVAAWYWHFMLFLWMYIFALLQFA
jgi:cytochrome c oxidase subunit 3